MHLPHTPVSAIVIFVAYFINPWLWVNREKHVESYVKIIQNGSGLFSYGSEAFDSIKGGKRFGRAERLSVSQEELYCIQ